MRTSLVAIALTLGCGAARSAEHPATDAIQQAWADWQEERTRSLAGEDGWLTLVALCWIDGDELTIGSSEDADCRVEEPAAPRIGAVLVGADGARFLTERDVIVTEEGAPVTERILISDASDPHTVLEHGSLRIQLIDRGGRLGIRIKDRESEARLSFSAVPVHPYDASMRVPAHFVAAEAGATLPIVNVLGMAIDEPIAGQLTFELGGASHTLVAMPGGDGPEDGLFVMLRDATSGETSYGGGRYLEVPLPDADGATVLDFNFLETPPCGFTELATCPLPPAENELDVRVDAGELWLGEH